MELNDIKLRILDKLKSSKKNSLRRRELFNLVKQSDTSYQDFKKDLNELEREGKVVRLKGRRFALPEESGVFTGIFSASRSGGGVIYPDDGSDYFQVYRADTNTAMDGDHVQAVRHRKRRDKDTRAARITNVLERRSRPLVGEFRRTKKSTYIVPHEEGFRTTLMVLEGEEASAEDGDLVVAHIKGVTTGHSKPIAKIDEVLGTPDEPGVAMRALIYRRGLPTSFPDEVVAETENLPDGLDDATISKRRDIRSITTFTIDPDDAKDFDDAISISRADDGGYDIGIHIADVAHYVKKGSALDKEAQKRAMSCYLVDRVIPMLPERLSNGLCSLKPNVDRLTKSVFAHLGPDGSIISCEIADTVMHSHARLTYSQAQASISGEPIPGGKKTIPPDVGESLQLLSEVTDKLLDQRRKRGSLDLEMPEAKVILDDDGWAVDIIRYPRYKAHRMIEESMLLANTIIADELTKLNAQFLYRVHESPDEKALEAFSETASSFGFEFKARKPGDIGLVQDFIDSIRGKDSEQLLSMMLLRSMKKAMYSPENKGHYGLGYETYTHFTSPIRRYPDLITHRKSEQYLTGLSEPPPKDDSTDYGKLGEYITAKEIECDAAERESIKMKTAEFMQDKVGEEFTATVSGMMRFGFFVQLDSIFVEGLVHVNSLEDDYYDLDDAGFAMVGRRKGNQYRMGDRLKVQLIRADPEAGEVDFRVLEKLNKNKKRKNKKK